MNRHGGVIPSSNHPQKPASQKRDYRARHRPQLTESRDFKYYKPKALTSSLLGPFLGLAESEYACRGQICVYLRSKVKIFSPGLRVLPFHRLQGAFPRGSTLASQILPERKRAQIRFPYRVRHIFQRTSARRPRGMPNAQSIKKSPRVGR